MAIYSNSWKIISRGQGRNAVHAAAYRHGAVMEEEAGPGRFDYRHKDEVVHSELALPNDTPKWLRTLLDGRDNDGASAALWNFVEQSEARKDAQLAKDGILSGLSKPTFPASRIATQCGMSCGHLKCLSHWLILFSIPSLAN